MKFFQRRLRLLLVVFGALLAPGSIASHAQAALPDIVKPPPSINLGSTSFYDGFGRLKPGLTVLEYFRWQHSDEISDRDGVENVNFVQPRIDSFPSLTQFIVASKWRPFGGTAGFSVLVPLVGLRTGFAANSPKRLPADEPGFGDIIAGPTYQSKYFLRGTGSRPLKPGSVEEHSRPFLAWRAQFLVQIPNGKFDSKKSVNPGSGYWAVVPYLAATYMPWRKLEMSTRLHYQYNLPTTKLANPPPIPHLVYVNGQAGQLVYGNFTTSYRVTRKLYVGANSYGVYQLSPDRTNGVTVNKARESQFYLGPGGGFDFSRTNTLNVNLYLKVEAHNTASGPALQMLYIHRF